MKRETLTPFKISQNKVSILPGSCGSGLQFMWCGVVRCGVVKCDVVWCGEMWCGVVRCVVWCGEM